jgi:hypothetical protein
VIEKCPGISAHAALAEPPVAVSEGPSRSSNHLDRKVTGNRPGPGSGTLLALITASVGLLIWTALVWILPASILDRGGPEAEPVPTGDTVTGSWRLGDGTPSPVGMDWRGFHWTTGYGTMSDPRVEGVIRTGEDLGVDTLRSVVHVTAEGGVWKGMSTGYLEHGVHEAEALLVGTQAYEGLQYRFRHVTTDGLGYGVAGTVEPLGTPGPSSAGQSVTGSSTCTPISPPPGYLWSGWEWFECLQVTSDPRADGRMRMGWLPDPDVAMGYLELRDVGDVVWQGTFSGVETPEGYLIDGFLLGAHAYDGLQQRVRASSGDRLTFEIEVTIEEAAWLMPGPAPASDGFTTDERDSIATRTVRISGTACDDPVLGSGFAVGEDLIATNAHVVVGADELEVETADGRSIPAIVVAWDDVDDLAVLRASGAGLEPLDLGRPSEGTLGSMIGWESRGPEPTPFRIAHAMSIPTHVVAGDEPIERESWIVAAEIDFGDSGAPLVDHDQRVIAIAYGTIAHGPDVTYAVGADRLEALMVSSDLTTEVDVPTCG